MVECNFCGRKESVFGRIQECVNCLKHMCEKCTANQQIEKKQLPDQNVKYRRNKRKYTVCIECVHQRSGPRAHVRHFERVTGMNRLNSDFNPVYLLRIPDTPNMINETEYDNKEESTLLSHRLSRRTNSTTVRSAKARHGRTESLVESGYEFDPLYEACTLTWNDEMIRTTTRCRRLGQANIGHNKNAVVVPDRAISSR